VDYRRHEFFGRGLRGPSALRQFPESGHRYEKYRDKHIRILLYGHYRVAYLIRDKNTIQIIGVLRGALDIDEHLKRIL
jgi:plasmid stabilization system protein ParE